MLSRAVARDFGERLGDSLLGRYRLFGPVADGTGSCRLGEVESWTELQPGALTRLPAKKVLLPPCESLWSWDGQKFLASKSDSIPLALIGLPACELQAIDYLDRIFVDDRQYRRRRKGLLRIAASCTPSSHCFCSVGSQVPSCDLLLGEKLVWAGSQKGNELLEKLTGGAAQQGPAPVWISGPAEPGLPSFEQLPGPGPFWERVAERCLGCGACSAVCPTCYCYSMHDKVDAAGRSCRERHWDNCFFPQHARIAGGMNFRSTRGERLRFRAEHKLLGFEPLRGQCSCVGCGRCREACPVQIDIAELAATLAAGEGNDV